MKEHLFDIGACKGWETIDDHLCSYHTKRPWKDNYNVVCVEANPSLIPALETEFSSYDNVKIVNAAVSDSEATHIDFYLSEYTISTCSLERTKVGGRFAEKYNPQDKISVPAVSVDSLVKEHGTPSFIKIDVEGYEDKVLKSFTKNYCPISFEWTEEECRCLKDSLEVCHQLGYTKFWPTLGNLGIQNTLADLDAAIHNCPYWTTQNAWMEEAGVKSWGPKNYADIQAYIDDHTVAPRQTLWGQIYCE